MLLQLQSLLTSLMRDSRLFSTFQISSSYIISSYVSDSSNMNPYADEETSFCLRLVVMAKPTGKDIGHPKIDKLAAQVRSCIELFDSSVQPAALAAAL